MAMRGDQAYEMVESRFRAEGTSYNLILMDSNAQNATEAVSKIKSFIANNRPTNVAQPYYCLLAKQSWNDELFKDKARLDSIFDQFVSKPIFKAGVQSLLTKSGILS